MSSLGISCCLASLTFLIDNNPTLRRKSSHGPSCPPSLDQKLRRVNSLSRLASHGHKRENPRYHLHTLLWALPITTPIQRPMNFQGSEQTSFCYGTVLKEDEELDTKSLEDVVVQAERTHSTHFFTVSELETGALAPSLFSIQRD